MPDLQLAALLCSRLCHDLIGPIGALGNGVEILADEDDPSMREQATQLLGDSADEAARRLRFYRLAFGAAGGGKRAIPLSEAREAALGFFRKGRTALDWPLEAVPMPTDQSLTKLLLNLILLAGAALPRGGTLSVRLGDAEHSRVVVAAAGAGARVDGETRTALGQNLDRTLLDSQNVIAFYAAALAGNEGFRVVAASVGEDRVEFTLVPI
jgi:histidine phosphotransferase ChpT